MKSVWALSKLVIKEIFRKKDFYAALILIAAVLFYAAQLKFYNVENITRYLMEIGLALIYFFSVILTVSLAARQYPSEVQNRTCHVLFSKPIRRAEFILGKFLGSFLAGVSCFLSFYILFLVVIGLKGAELSMPVAAQAVTLFVLNLLVVAAMASALSYYFTVSANISMTLVLYVLVSVYGAGLKRQSEGLFWLSRWLGEVFYYALPHFEFFDLRQRFIHGWGPVPWPIVVILSLYALCYASIFLLLAWLKLRRQPL